MNRLRPALLAALLATGCIPDTAKLDPLRSAGAFCPVALDLNFSKLATCRGYAPAYVSYLYGSSQETCDYIAAAEKAGRVGFDRAAAEACLADLTQPGCASINGGACDNNNVLMVPKVPPGGQCLTGDECTSASAGCFNTALTCPGTCTPPALSGGACNGPNDPPCANALYCDTSAAPFTCKARLATGAPGCTGNPPCLNSDYCDTSASPPSCRAMLGVGASCNPSGTCDYTRNIYCDTASGKCVQGNNNATVGQSCAGYNNCADGLWCDFSVSLCAAPLPLGSTCTYSSACGDPGAGCIADSTVTGSLKHCRLLRTEGASCQVGVSACQYGLYCIGSPAGATGVCQTLPTAVGALCGDLYGESVSCLQGWCNRALGATSGTCAATAATWAACTSGNECRSSGFGLSSAQCLDTTGSSHGAGLHCVPSCAQGGAQGSTN